MYLQAISLVLAMYSLAALGEVGVGDTSIVTFLGADKVSERRESRLYAELKALIENMERKGVIDNRRALTLKATISTMNEDQLLSFRDTLRRRKEGAFDFDLNVRPATCINNCNEKELRQQEENADLKRLNSQVHRLLTENQ